MTIHNPLDPSEGYPLYNIPHPHIYKKVSDLNHPVGGFVFRRREWICRFCPAKKVKLTL